MKVIVYIAFCSTLKSNESNSPSPENTRKMLMTKVHSFLVLCHSIMFVNLSANCYYSSARLWILHMLHCNVKTCIDKWVPLISVTDWTVMVFSGYSGTLKYSEQFQPSPSIIAMVWWWLYNICNSLWLLNFQIQWFKTFFMHATTQTSEPITLPLCAQSELGVINTCSWFLFVNVSTHRCLIVTTMKDCWFSIWGSMKPSQWGDMEQILRLLTAGTVAAIQTGIEFDLHVQHTCTCQHTLCVIYMCISLTVSHSLSLSLPRPSLSLFLSLSLPTLSPSLSCTLPLPQDARKVG